MDMNWAHILLLLCIPFITSISIAQETDVTETTTLESNNVSNDVPSSPDSQAQLDSNLRNALLKALSELEGDSSEVQELDNDEQNIARAQASAVTYFANDGLEKIATSEEEQSNAKSIENQITTTTQETVSGSESPENSAESSDNNLTEKVSEVLVQKSHAIQGVPITAIERKPVDFFKDAEQIITSASNSFITQNDEPVSSHTPRSVKSAESHSKISSFSNLNTIRDLESKTSIKEVDEAPFVKTYVRPLGNFVENDVAYVKSSETANSDETSKTSVTSEVKSTQHENSGVKSNGKDGLIETTTTAATVQVSTEESEAKVEQVQFFSAPLVAAFTVHQDEKGDPKKVEPIFKNDLNPTKGPSPIQQNLLQKSTNFQTSPFNNAELQKKQQILEQELEKLRNQQLLQQQNILTRNNVGSNSAFNNPSLTQAGFRQAIKQNFNQFDPIFTEPDRSVVTKLATIDPSTLLSQNGGPLLNKFTINDAMFPFGNTANSLLQNPKTKSDISLIPSIAFDPIIESGRLPLNAQVLPNREPTGFRNFVPNTQNIRPQIQSSVPSLPNGNIGQNLNFAQSNLVQQQQNLIRPSQNLAQPNQNFIQSTSSLIQPSVSNFVDSTGQNSGQTLQNINLLRNQAIQTGLNPVQTQSNNFLGSNNNIRGQSQNNQFLTSNRILRQEQGSGNLGSNQHGFAIIPSQQPFNPIHELSYFPDNKRILSQNQASITQSNLIRPIANVGFQGAQNSIFSDNSQHQNRLFRSNLEGSVASPNSFNIQQSVQPLGQQIFNNNPQNNRFFRSNQEGTLGTSLNFGNGQNLGLSQSQIDQNNRFLRSNQESTFLNNQNRFVVQPTVQNYKYSSSFGFPTIPLNK